MTEITYDAAVAAKKLAEAIRGLGVNTGLLRADAADLNGTQLLQVLGAATDRINELQGTQPKTGVEVDIFWERQGWYFHEVGTTSAASKEYESIDACARAAHAQGYNIRDVRRTRGSVKQPTPPVVPRKASDAE